MSGPAYHARTHLLGGTDPLRGLLPELPSGTVEEIIVATFPGAYYKLDETTGGWADSSGAERHATYVGSLARGVAAQLDEGDDAKCVTVDGEIPASGSTPSAVGICTDEYFEFAGVSEFTVSALIRPSWVPPEGSDFSMGVCGNVPSSADEARGWGLFILSDLFDPDAPGDLYSGAAARACFRRTQSTGVVQQAVGPQVAAHAWVRLTGVFDGDTMGLWMDDVQVASSSGATVSLPSGGSTFRMGDCGIHEGIGGGTANFLGEIDSVIVWDRALTTDEIDLIINGGQPGSQDGWVPTTDEDGNVTWQPPGVEIEHGGAEPDEEEVVEPNPLAGPTNPSGWHYSAHFETAVLYDSTPARFDVPSRKWTRVPFNTVRIQRRWETVVDGDIKSAWLPDDRGLTEQARNGLLHITSAMSFGAEDHTVNGWFAIEYPVIDYLGLPDDDMSADAYARAARFVNASTGQVLRTSPGSVYRKFFEWQMPTVADGIPIFVEYNADNPYPIYPVWAARPLTKPLPYPSLSPTESLSYYQTYLGNPGFDDDNLEVTAQLSAGDNICLQAWQDSPYLLRFTTDHFANYSPNPSMNQWRRRPNLAITYFYDPDTIDHTTGALL